MQHRILLRSLLILLATVILASSLDNSQWKPRQTNSKRSIASSISGNSYWRKPAPRKPGFFKTLFSVLYEQYVDSKQTYQNITKLVNSGFAPENAPKIETTTNADPNVSTTKAPYRITRTELNKILRKNLLGIARLYTIEVNDALKQSDKNWADFKKNASKEFSKFL